MEQKTLWQGTEPRSLAMLIDRRVYYTILPKKFDVLFVIFNIYRKSTTTLPIHFFLEDGDL